MILLLFYLGTLRKGNHPESIINLTTSVIFIRKKMFKDSRKKEVENLLMTQTNEVEDSFFQFLRSAATAAVVVRRMSSP